MKIVSNTTFTPYNKNTRIKPTQPVWAIRNTGNVNAFINGSRLPVGSFFGIDALPLLIPVIENLIKGGEKINIINDTEFEVTFEEVYSLAIPQVTLIETSFKFFK